MGFTWVFINPIEYPGFSGSLYATKDPTRLHPLIQGDSPENPAVLIRRFVAAAKDHGLSVMMDMVINHTAKDSLLAETRPQWFAHDEDGQLHSPRAVDPGDTNNVTIWGDLAEIDWRAPDFRDEKIAYFQARMAASAELGISGFRYDAAYKLPSDILRTLTQGVKSEFPDLLIIAENLGCTEEETLAMSGCGIDFFYNSSKWWDFRASWLLEQYEHDRHVAPSISFPESHDTERFATELAAYSLTLDTILKWYRLRYLFACAFSTGIMMPMGYEYGFRKKLDVCTTRASDWDEEMRDPMFDLCADIQAFNATKDSCPALNTEGPQRLLSEPGAPVIAMLREDGNHASLFLMNRDAHVSHEFPSISLLSGLNGRAFTFSELTQGFAPADLSLAGHIVLPPLEGRLFCGSAS
ncbi:MAG: hypothetical protein A2018_00140 [Alphaproteobacteria bacterium GWF2_58_20]|nr:MAG: hypothetical protein A2018_00140 [Alphaproteobacteria bacterium GWF2_58_20]